MSEKMRKSKKVKCFLIILAVLVLIQTVYKLTYQVRIDFEPKSIEFVPDTKTWNHWIDFGSSEKTAEKTYKENAGDYCGIIIRGFAINKTPFYLRKYKFVLDAPSDESDLFVDNSVEFVREAPYSQVIYSKSSKELAVKAFIRKDLAEGLTPEKLKQSFRICVKGKIIAATHYGFPEIATVKPENETYYW
ncbi:MAG: hypothetical protein K6G90_02640 [Clostridia bacterium]|nr:hypothetical protein [Clostridia bacterium]